MKFQYEKCFNDVSDGNNVVEQVVAMHTWKREAVFLKKIKVLHTIWKGKTVYE